MTWYKRNPHKNYFIKCRVCGVDLDTRKPDDIFRHHHAEILSYTLWACWPGYVVFTPNDRRGQKAYMPQRVCLN